MRTQRAPNFKNIMYSQPHTAFSSNQKGWGGGSKASTKKH